MVPWIRICLPVRGSRSLVCEDYTCCGLTYLRCQNYWAHKPQLLNPHALEPASLNYCACMLQLLKPVHLDPILSNNRSHHNEKPCAPQIESRSTPPSPLSPNSGSLQLDKAHAEITQHHQKEKCSRFLPFVFPLNHLTFCRDLASINKGLHFEIHLSLMVSFFLFF